MMRVPSDAVRIKLECPIYCRVADSGTGVGVAVGNAAELIAGLQATSNKDIRTMKLISKYTHLLIVYLLFTE
jgi:hypothetical protein